MACRHTILVATPITTDRTLVIVNPGDVTGIPETKRVPVPLP